MRNCPSPVSHRLVPPDPVSFCFLSVVRIFRGCKSSPPASVGGSLFLNESIRFNPRQFVQFASKFFPKNPNESYQTQANRGKSRRRRPRTREPVTGGVAQTFLFAGSRNFPVPCSGAARSCPSSSRAQGRKLSHTRPPHRACCKLEPSPLKSHPIPL